MCAQIYLEISVCWGCALKTQRDCGAPGNEISSCNEIPLMLGDTSYMTDLAGRTGGKIYGPGGAAELLDLPPTTLQSKLRRYGLR
jgi:hypothetical protein